MFSKNNPIRAYNPDSHQQILMEEQRDPNAPDNNLNPYSSNVILHLGPRLPTVEDHVQIQVLRVNALDKLNKIKQIFTLNNQSLKPYLETYEPYKQSQKQVPHFKLSNQGKILKKNNSIYYGDTIDNRMEGKGILFINEGRIYEGGFSNNEKSGEGYEVYPSGNVFIGQFERNQKHGHGVYFWFEASMKVLEGCCSTQYYKGDWWGGMPSGNGIHHRLTGDIYEGQFKNGLKHGSGLEKHPNGDTYKGQYVNGLPEGYGEYQWRDKSIYKGDFRQGLRQGFGIWKEKQFGESEQYQGHYLSDKKSGYGIYVWNKSQYYKGQFFEDKRHGFGELYLNNKLAYEGAWENGEKNPEIKYKKRPVCSQPIKFVHKAKLITEEDEKVSSKRGYSASTKNGYFRNQSIQNLKQPKFKQTVKKSITRNHYNSNSRANLQHNSIQRVSLNPQAVRIQRHPNHFSRSGHRHCIPIDQYLSVNKGLTKR